MIKNLALILGFVLSFNFFHDAKADDFVAYKRGGNSNQSYLEKNPTQPVTGDDSKIVAATEKKRRLDFVEGSGMVVIKLLPDDRDGLKHQKWLVRLSNGQTMQAVYNLDMCDYVPLKVGDVVAMGGQFIWTNQGALLHWLHYDPRQKRPDGYVELNGKVYCGDGQRHN